MRSRRLATSIVIVVILVSGLSAVILFNLYDRNTGDPFTNLTTSTVSDSAQVTAEFEFNLPDNQFLKGDTINFTLTVTITQNNATIQSVLVKVRDLNTTISGEQTVLINEKLEPGTYTYNLSLNPGFPENGFVTLGFETYQFEQFRVNYRGFLKTDVYEGSLNTIISGYSHEAYNRLKDVEWELPIHANHTIETQPSAIQLNSSAETGLTEIVTMVDLKAATRIYYNVTGYHSSHILFQLNNITKAQIIGDTGNFTAGHIFIGNSLDTQELRVRFETVNFDNLTLTLNLTTKYVPLFVVLANNHFEGLSDDSSDFREIEYYLDQTSNRFLNVFNVSLIPVAKVDFESNSGSNLQTLREDARSQVGEKLLFPNNQWDLTPGRNENNSGADILLIFTNKTMDHLGIVYGQAGGPRFNLAINARGSNNTGLEETEFSDLQLRLTPSFADNLIQHEVSHIFGAEDRWTSNEDPSVMTKSQAAEAVADLLFGDFWLTRTNWLVEDIELMSDGFFRYY